MSDLAVRDRESKDILSKIPQAIMTQEEYDAGTEILKTITSLIKTIEEDFKESIELAHKAHKAVLAQRDSHIKPLKEAEKVIKTMAASFITVQEKIKADEKKLADEKAKKDAETLKSFGLEEEASEILSTPIPAEKVQTNGISYRETWRFEITDSDQIPRHFLIPDETKIGQYVRTMKEGSQIPGIRVFVEKTAIVR